MLIPSPLAKMDKRRLGRLQLPVVLSEDGHLREDDAVAMAVHESLSFTALENDDNPVCQSAASKPHKRLAIFAAFGEQNGDEFQSRRTFTDVRWIHSTELYRAGETGLHTYAAYVDTYRFVTSGTAQPFFVVISVVHLRIGGVAHRDRNAMLQQAFTSTKSEL
ncbi:hypothetical protein F442_10089 [Phytophthora nicotianae P10297]|uniref:Uncharacterized protein n=1 Tax=Phytophthora nicotianae P10297 TaxID=1317064 RepID=W2Z7J3_PHYNI|nr:hypothetical protein F442_10089 [Phytophthora nicotianae P10297]